MKTSNILLLSAFALVLIGITTFMGYFKNSVMDNCIEGVGAIVEKELKAEPFKGIIINNNLNIEITQDTVQKITVVAEENLIDNFSIVVIDGQLKISRIYCMKKSKKAFIKVSVDTLERLKVQSGGKVRSTNALIGEWLYIDVNSGGEVRLELEFNEVECNLTAGAEGTLRGNASRFQSEISAGSMLKAEGLVTKNCIVSANSGAHAEVFVTEELTATSSSGASIKYAGDPLKKNIDENSGGSVRKMED